jgi:hypothetical protein
LRQRIEKKFGLEPPGLPPAPPPPDGDHAFSACRAWLVEAVTDWLAARLGD